MSTAAIYLTALGPFAAGLVLLLTGWGIWVWRTSNGGRARRAARRAAKKPEVPWFLTKEEAAVPLRPALPAALMPVPWRSGLYSWDTGDLVAVVAAMGDAA